MHWQRVDKAARTYSGCKHGELAVLRAIIRHCDEWSNAWPGTELIATKTGLTRRRVQQLIRVLAEKGYIEIVKSCAAMQCRNKRGDPIRHDWRLQHYHIYHFPGEDAEMRIAPKQRWQVSDTPTRRRRAPKQQQQQAQLAEATS